MPKPAQRLTLRARIKSVLMACSPWLVTGLVGLWRWDGLSRTGTDLKFVVLTVVVLCGVGMVLAAVKAWKGR
jgi:hypothetical protein